MKKNDIIILLLSLFALFASCASDEETISDNPNRDVVIKQLSNKTWTYVSLSKSKIMGTSAYGDLRDDEKWAKRTDWDFALCGKFIRTNSGSSGIGNGGIVKVMGINYSEITSPTTKTFVTDSIFKE